LHNRLLSRTIDLITANNVALATTRALPPASWSGSGAQAWPLRERKPMSQPAQKRAHPGIWIAITILLAASLVGVLWVPFYARTTPALGGWPFFYWYQMLWVPIVAVLSWAAYVLSKRATRGSSAGAPPAGSGTDSGEAAR
jgi:hypothetical protein